MVLRGAETLRGMACRRQLGHGPLGEGFSAGPLEWARISGLDKLLRKWLDRKERDCISLVG